MTNNTVIPLTYTLHEQIDVEGQMVDIPDQFVGGSGYCYVDGTCNTYDATSEYTQMAPEIQNRSGRDGGALNLRGAWQNRDATL